MLGCHPATTDGRCFIQSHFYRLEMEGYDSDLDDEVAGNRFVFSALRHSTEANRAATLPRLSFEQTLATHRNNRMNQTFGQRVFPQRTRDDSDSDNLTLLPSSSKSKRPSLVRISARTHTHRS